LALLKKDTSGFAFQVLSFGSVFFAPAKKMNPSDMTEDTTSIRATASFARKGAHELNFRPFKKKNWIPACAGMTRKRLDAAPVRG
jgi:hypothetical protein